MAVELCLSGKPTGEVANKLGVRADLLSRWKREYKQKREGGFSGHGKPSLTPEQEEIDQLKKRLREAEIERDILKKAGAAPQSASSPRATTNIPVYERAPDCFAVERMCKAFKVSRSGGRPAATIIGSTESPQPDK